MYGTLGRSLCLKAPVRTRLARFSCAIHFPCSNFPIDRPQTKDRRRFSKSINESHLSPSFSRTWKIRMAMTTNAASEKNVLVPIAQGTEEMEAVIIIDVLRRAGAKVTVASIENERAVTCSRGVHLVADALLSDVSAKDFDLIALPGGTEGAERFKNASLLNSMIQQQQKQGKLLAAICASPGVVLEPLGILKEKKATTHPAFVDRLSDPSEVENRVVIDGDVITSRGPGTSFEFALALVQHLFGEEKRQQIADPMVIYNHPPSSVIAKAL